MSSFFSSLSKRDATLQEIVNKEQPICSPSLTPTEMALRAAFEKETYRLVSDPLTGSIISGPIEAFLTSTTKVYMKEKWDQRVYILRHYFKGDPDKNLSVKKFQEKHRLDFLILWLSKSMKLMR